MINPCEEELYGLLSVSNTQLHVFVLWIRMLVKRSYELDDLDANS